MINFTVGPVMSSEQVIKVANASTPYFRTPEFSNIMLENERMFLQLLNAPDDSRCVFLTASGTGAMESCVMNILNDDDEVIVINGGGFGKRFVELCQLHKRRYYEVKCGFGQQVRMEQLAGLEHCSALLVNMHETSSGILYDMDMISRFCKENGILLIVDAISSFISDELDMEDLGAAAVITGSQKALAVQPGVSLIALAPVAVKRVEDNEEKCLYLSIKQALTNGVRGQTPFTPAVTTLLQIHTRLKEIIARGGIEVEREMIVKNASFIRKSLQGLPFENVSENPSNTVTAIRTKKQNAEEIVRILKDEYGIWVCPNGGEYSSSVFRIGHIGCISQKDNEELVQALQDMNDRGIL